jgi:hypothetical protein
MQSLKFLSRVAFVCNVCFVLVLLMHWYPVLKEGPAPVTATVAVLGIAVALIINSLVNVCILIYILRYRQGWKHFPAWLIIANFLFLLPQLILFVK